MPHSTFSASVCWAALAGILLAAPADAADQASTQKVQNDVAAECGALLSTEGTAALLENIASGAPPTAMRGILAR